MCSWPAAAGQDAPVHRLVAGFQLGFKLLQHLRHGLSQCRHVGVAQYPLLVLLPLGLWNEVLVETTEAQRVTDINIARFETVAQHAVHQKFVLVGVDAPVFVRILLVEIRLRALWNERLGDLLEATANQASTLVEAGFQEIDRLQQIGVLALTGAGTSVIVVQFQQFALLRVEASSRIVMRSLYRVAMVGSLFLRGCGTHLFVHRAEADPEAARHVLGLPPTRPRAHAAFNPASVAFSDEIVLELGLLQSSARR